MICSPGYTHGFHGKEMYFELNCCSLARFTWLSQWRHCSRSKCASVTRNSDGRCHCHFIPSPIDLTNCMLYQSSSSPASLFIYSSSFFILSFFPPDHFPVLALHPVSESNNLRHTNNYNGIIVHLLLFLCSSERTSKRFKYLHHTNSPICLPLLLHP